MKIEDPIVIVEAWQEAANSQNAERLIELSDPNIEIAGPRGSGFGHQLLRDWLSRAGLTLETVRIFSRGDTVVLWQHGAWRSPETGEVTGERDVASRFRVLGGRVTAFARYDSLDSALQESGLGSEDEVARK